MAHLFGHHKSQIAADGLEFRHRPVSRFFFGGHGGHIHFKHQRRLRQIVFLQPLRVQFADKADGLAIEHNLGGAPRMQRRMSRFDKLHGFAGQQGLYIGFGIVKIHAAAFLTPLLGQRRAIQQAADTLVLHKTAV